MSPDDRDLPGLLAADHHRLRMLLVRVADTPPGEPLRAELLAEVRGLLERHMSVEEEVLHPLVLQLLPERAGVVAHESAGFAAMGALLDDLAGLPEDSARFERDVALLVDAVTGHVEDQQALILGDLGAVASPLELREAADRARSGPLRRIRRPGGDRVPLRSDGSADPAAREP